MVVIENENNSFWDGSDVVDQRGQDGFRWWWLRRLKHVQRAFPWRGFDLLGLSEGSDKVCQKLHRVIVAFIQ